MYEAANRSKINARTPNIDIVVGWVEPSSDGELNEFVAQTFGRRAECSWAQSTVVCRADNRTVAYAVNEE
jgi:hypothetical protein